MKFEKLGIKLSQYVTDNKWEFLRFFINLVISLSFVLAGMFNGKNHLLYWVFFVIGYFVLTLSQKKWLTDKTG